MVTTEILNKIKKRLGLPENVNVYDEEFMDLIEGALFDMKESGVPSELLDAQTPNPQVINCIAFFVKMERAENEKEGRRYEKLYEKYVFRLAMCNEVVKI